VCRWLIPGLSIALLLGVLLFLFPFNTGVSSVRTPLGFALWSAWTTVDYRGQQYSGQDYSYCLLVPLVLAWLIFEERALLVREPVKGMNAAIGLLLFGLLLFWIGAKAGKQIIGCGAIQVLLAGMILWFWGRSVFRVLLFPWAIITFAWPMPFLDSAVAFPMRMIVSRLSAITLNLIGVHSIRTGTAIYSAPNPMKGLAQGGRFQIDIADPCSGIHSLVALLLFSALFSYFFLPHRWQQWAVFLSTIPFIIVGNIVRILLLVAGNIRYGEAFAIGTLQNPSWYHEACGFAVFVVVLGSEYFLGCGLIVSGRARGAPTKSKHRKTANAAGPVAGGQPISEPFAVSGVPVWRDYVAFGLAAAMFGLGAIHSSPELPPQAGVVMTLPDQVVVPGLPGGGRFSAFYAAVSDVEQEILPKDTEFARNNYDDFNGHQVFFSIVLSGQQQYTIHPPEVCLVAQGWTITGGEYVPIHLASGRDLIVRNLSIQRDFVDADGNHLTLHSYFMYWYVAEGVTTASHLVRNVLSSWDRVVHNRDHRWAYLIAMSPITASVRPNGLDAPQTRQMLADFIKQIVPVVQKSEMSNTGGD
jgi:EpsI family protein